MVQGHKNYDAVARRPGQLRQGPCAQPRCAWALLRKSKIFL